MVLKKVICVALTLALLSLCGVYGAAPAQTVFNDESVQLLHAVGLINNVVYETESFFETMTRAEFCGMIARLIGIDVGEAYPNDVFTDLPNTQSYITALYRMGIISGYGGEFGPDRAITDREISKILVNLLGLSALAQARGNDLNAYVALAAENKLFEGIKAIDNTRASIYKMVYNALHQNVYKQTAYGSGEKYRKSDVPLIKDAMGIDFGTGIVTRCGNKSVSEDTIRNDGVVQIDNRLNLSPNGKDYDSYLGFRVKYYYREIDSEQRRLITVIPGKNKVLKIDIEDIKQLGLEKITYINSAEKETAVNVDFNANIIYNGKAWRDYDDSWRNLPGFVTLIDNMNDGTFDQIFINAYDKTLFVSSVMRETGLITDHYGDTLDLEDEDEAVFIYKSERSDIREVNKNSVISVMKDKQGKVQKILISKEFFKGVAQVLAEDGVIIDGKRYELSSVYRHAVDGSNANVTRVNAGDAATFYLDIEGKIAGAEKNTAGVQKYGYLIEMGKRSGLSSDIQLILYTQNQKIEALDLKRTVDFNGKNIKETELYDNKSGYGLDDPQLVRYSQAETGEISKLESAKHSDGNLNDFRISVSQTALAYRPAGRSFNGVFGVDDDTKVLLVPGDISKRRDESDYKITNLNYFTPDESYTVSAYDVDETNIAEVVVMAQSSGASYITPDSRVGLVAKVSLCIYMDEEHYKLSVLHEGVEKTVYAKKAILDEAVFENGGNDSPKGITAGCVIQYTTDGLGRIDSVQKVLDIHLENPSQNRGNPNSEDYNARSRTMLGSVARRTGNYILFRHDNGNRDNYYINSAKFYYYDTRQKSGKVVKIDEIDKSIGTEKYKVFMASRWSQVRDIIIFKVTD